MILYLIRSILCLALMLAVYLLFLEKEKMYRFNRFYLLFSLVFSSFAPLIAIEGYTHLIPNKANVLVTAVESGVIEAPSFPIGAILLAAYACIALGLVFRLIRNVWLIISRALNNERISCNSAEIVLLDSNAFSHTFWNYIFVDSKEYANNIIEKEIIIHELAHAKQKHTLDILLIEFLQAVFWINPVFIFYKKAIQLNHEFLADEAVVLAYNSPKNYQILLLNKISGNSMIFLSSSFNYRITKKRLNMLASGSKSSGQLLFKKLLLIPVVLLALFLFTSQSYAAKGNAGEEKQKILEKPDKKTKKGANTSVEPDMEKGGIAPVVEIEVPVSVEISPPG